PSPHDALPIWANAREASLPRWNALIEELGKADPNINGKELDDIRTAKTVRVRDGEVIITDGPFAETREQIGGLFDVKLPDLDSALEVAPEEPAAEVGSVHARPVGDRREQS